MHAHMGSLGCHPPPAPASNPSLPHVSLQASPAFTAQAQRPLWLPPFLPAPAARQTLQTTPQEQQFILRYEYASGFQSRLVFSLLLLVSLFSLAAAAFEVSQVKADYLFMRPTSIICTSITFCGACLAARWLRAPLQPWRRQVYLVALIDVILVLCRCAVHVSQVTLQRNTPQECAHLSMTLLVLSFVRLSLDNAWLANSVTLASLSLRYRPRGSSWAGCLAHLGPGGMSLLPTREARREVSGPLQPSLSEPTAPMATAPDSAMDAAGCTSRAAAGGTSLGSRSLSAAGGTSLAVAGGTSLGSLSAAGGTSLAAAGGTSLGSTSLSAAGGTSLAAGSIRLAAAGSTSLAAAGGASLAAAGRPDIGPQGPPLQLAEQQATVGGAGQQGAEGGAGQQQQEGQRAGRGSPEGRVAGWQADPQGAESMVAGQHAGQGAAEGGAGRQAGQLGAEGGAAVGAGLQTAEDPAGQQAGQQAGQLAGRQAGQLAGRQAGRQAGQQAGRQAGQQAGRQAGQPAGQPAGQQEATEDGGGQATPLGRKLLYVDAPFPDLILPAITRWALVECVYAGLYVALAYSVAREDTLEDQGCVSNCSDWGAVVAYCLSFVIFVVCSAYALDFVLTSRRVAKQLRKVAHPPHRFACILSHLVFQVRRRGGGGSRGRGPVIRVQGSGSSD